MIKKFNGLSFTQIPIFILGVTCGTIYCFYLLLKILLKVKRRSLVKLVRDLIPDLMRRKGENPSSFKIEDDLHYEAQLKLKLMRRWRNT